jgi:hypothetical protein
VEDHRDHEHAPRLASAGWQPVGDHIDEHRRGVGVLMTYSSCADCGLRFTTAFVAVSQNCPMCCGPLSLDLPAADVVGTELYFDMPPDRSTIPRADEQR